MVLPILISPLKAITVIKCYKIYLILTFSIYTLVIFAICNLRLQLENWSDLKTTKAAFCIVQAVVAFPVLFSHVIRVSSSLVKYMLIPDKGGALYGITWFDEFFLSTSLRHVDWGENLVMLFKTKWRVLQWIIWLIKQFSLSLPSILSIIIVHGQFNSVLLEEVSPFMMESIVILQLRVSGTSSSTQQSISNLFMVITWSSE